MCIVLLLSVALSLAAQDAQHKIALVIGNGDYESLGRLSNPANDATDVAQALRRIGFDVDLLVDADLETMEAGLIRFGRQLNSLRDAIGFFFFAGHGVQLGGENYLIPARASIGSESFLRSRSISAQVALDEMQRAGNALNIVVLDACRDNPFGWARSGSRGLTAVTHQPPGSIVAYATSAGSIALDGTGRNGVFTAEFLQHIVTPGIDVAEVFRRTGQGVQEATNGKQIPAVYTQFFSTAYLSTSSQTETGEKKPGFIIEQEYSEVSMTVLTSGTVFLDGEEIGRLEAGQSATLSDVKIGNRSVEVRYIDGEREAQSISVRANSVATASFIYVPHPANGDGMIRGEVLVEGGMFSMGTTGGENNEEPVHQVTLDSYYMMRTEVTFNDYDAFARATGRDQPSDEGRGRGNRPVINVTWYDAVAYANWLSERNDLDPAYRISGTTVTWSRVSNGWRLPTEAEWEYAARGGNRSKGYKYAGSDNPNEVAWHNVNSDNYVHPVGQKKPNELGLYDMNGNVMEWCWDWYILGTSHALRGGAIFHDLQGLKLHTASLVYTASVAEAIWLKYRVVIGFRLVRAASTGQDESSTNAQQPTAESTVIIRDEVFVEGGSFSMGNPSGENDFERPVHQVTIDSFYMMKTEVTFSEYDEFAKATGRDLPDDEGWGRSNRPAIYVNWYDAVAYANWLSVRDDLAPVYRLNGANVTWNSSVNGWRLPTEAEWEYAARGGRSTPDTIFAGTDDYRSLYRYANFADSNTNFSWSDKSQNDGYAYTAPVGKLQPTELGLYDMSGKKVDKKLQLTKAIENRIANSNTPVDVPIKRITG